MTAGVTGDFAGLRKLESSLRRLTEVPSRAAVASSERIAALIQDEFDSQSDAYGNPWAPHSAATVQRWGEHDILDLTGDMMGSVDVSPMSGAGIAVTFDTDYASFHHTGTRRMPARPVFPIDTFPASWEAALEESAASAFEDIMGEVG